MDLRQPRWRRPFCEALNALARLGRPVQFEIHRRFGNEIEKANLRQQYEEAFRRHRVAGVTLALHLHLHPEQAMHDRFILTERCGIQRTHYPVTDGQEEWANELMALDQLVVEGFSRSHFKAKAEAAGITVDPQWGNLKLIGEVLRQQQVNEDEVNAVVSPLKSLHDLRSKMKGHAGGSDARTLRESLITKHGSLKSHYRALATDCDRAIALMAEFADKGVF